MALTEGWRLCAIEPGQGGVEESGRCPQKVAAFIIWVSGYIRYESVPGLTAMHSKNPDPTAKNLGSIHWRRFVDGRPFTCIVANIFVLCICI